MIEYSAATRAEAVSLHPRETNPQAGRPRAPIPHAALFAYPFGSAEDFNEVTREAVARAGFPAAFAAEEGLITTGTDRFAIPRMSVGDWSAQRLEEELLRTWLGDAYLRA